jgi:hypothetical protein
MASLSNINGLFDVHSTGAILFSTSHGTSGQILRSNGNAAPTWVAASTVIGGPYLPLTGGTLSGPLAGTSATFSGAIKQSSRITLNTNGTIQWGSANDYGLLSWDTGYALIYGQSGKGIKFATNGSTLALTLDTSQNASFAGNITVGDGHFIGDDANDNLLIQSSANENIIIDSLDELLFRNSGTTNLTIDSSGKSTFAGNVVLDTSSARLRIKSGAAGTNGGIDWTYNTASTQYARIDLNYDTRASVGLLIDSGYPITLDFSSGRFAIQHNGSEKMRIDSSGNVGINTTVFPSSGFAKLVVAGSAIAARPSGVNDYFSYIKSNWASENAFEIGIEGAGTQHRFITSGNYYYGTELRFWTSDTQRVTINSVGNFGIGTTLPAASAKLTVMGNQTFGLPGNGTNTSGRFISIEGNTDGSGEGSGRIFFSEHNSTTGLMDSYGMSLGYRGGATSIVGASGNTWTGLTQIGNGQWGMWGHNNNATGSLVMFGDRAATYVSIPGKVGIGVTSPGSKLEVAVADSSSILELTRTGSASFSTLISDIGAGAAQLWFNADTDDTGFLFRPRDSAGTPNNAFLIAPDGNVGIGTTTPYNRLHSSGVLGIGTANQTPGLTSTMSGGGGGAQYAAGSIYVVQGYAGTMSSGDTFTFIYEATSWKSWSAEFVFTSTEGMSRGAEGGYNNNGASHTSEMGVNALGCTATTTNVGQHVKIVFSFTNPGTHPMAKITYSQSGGDGVPRADRVNINWNT